MTSSWRAAMLAHPRLLMLATILAFAMVGGVLRYAVDPPAQTVFGGTSTVPVEVASLLPQIFRGGICHGAEASKAAVEAGLQELGLSDWIVEISDTVGAGDCVSSAIDAETKAIVLASGLHPAVKEAMDSVELRLIDECHDRDEAIALVREAIMRGPFDNWEVRIGGGLMAPIDRLAEVEAHVEAGCWIYNGTGQLADGTRLYWVGGPE